MNNVFELITSVNETEEKTIEQKTLKLAEECGEVAEAVLSFTKAPACAYKGKTSEDVLEECADVIILASSIAMSANYNAEDIMNKIKEKVVKWQSKIDAEKRR